jgi:hypothetical protein
MATALRETEKLPIGAQCDCARQSFPVAISDITCDGCAAEAPTEWMEDYDFLHLTIANGLEINGRVLRHQGRHATIRFFGQIHPSVVEHLTN